MACRFAIPARERVNINVYRRFSSVSFVFLEFHAVFQNPLVPETPLRFDRYILVYILVAGCEVNGAGTILVRAIGELLENTGVTEARNARRINEASFQPEFTWQ